MAEEMVQVGLAETYERIELRILGVLVEKEALTPDVYPMSINALTAGCNQLTSRDPIMKLDEATVRQALDQLIEKRLVSEVRQAGARVAKYEHRVRIKWVLEQDKSALLALLMLRGPQTAGELRARSNRLYEFENVEQAEKGLQFLIDKYPPFVVQLPRAPGTKESRYMHLLGGEIDMGSFGGGESAPPPRADRVGALEDEVANLKQEVAELKQLFSDFKKQFD